MKKKDRASQIHQQLDKLFPDVPIPLQHSDPYTLLVAVVLSAQCTDARVNTVTPSLFEKYADVTQMAVANVQSVQSIIRPCGLSGTKAKALVGLSQIIVDAHGGTVPQSFDELEALPGVGHKTAGVVMSQAFGHPAFPVDTHIHRLAKRWKLSNGKSVVQTERDLKKVFPMESWNKLHLQMIYFGRKYCPARGHEPSQCPICSWV